MYNTEYVTYCLDLANIMVLYCGLYLGHGVVCFEYRGMIQNLNCLLKYDYKKYQISVIVR